MVRKKNLNIEIVLKDTYHTPQNPAKNTFSRVPLSDADGTGLGRHSNMLARSTRHPLECRLKYPDFHLQTQVIWRFRRSHTKRYVPPWLHITFWIYQTHCEQQIVTSVILIWVREACESVHLTRRCASTRCLQYVQPCDLGAG